MRNKFAKTISLCLAAGCLLSVSALADTSGGATVNATALNLRSEPSTDSTSKLMMPSDAFVLVEEADGDWYKVVYEGVEGYASAEFLDYSDTLDGAYGAGAEVSGDHVRLRAGASTDDEILGKFNVGTGVEVLGVSGSWVKVGAPGGLTGFIRSDYLNLFTGDAGDHAQNADLGSQLVDSAKQYLGYSYVWGGMSTSGFDCSGFVNYVYKLYGYGMNRTAQNIFSNDGAWVDKEELQPGDLVFFGYSGSSVTHVGMYIGSGQFIHASSSAGKVVITELSQSYYTRMYVGAKRII